MRYFAKKFFAMLVTLFVISLITFLAFQLIPSDPAVKMLGSEYTPERAETLRETLWLNENVFLRYFKWLGGFFTGDLGISYSYSIPVSALLNGKILTTALLSLLAFLLTAFVSIPLGLLLARYEGGIIDRISVVLNQITMAIPQFFLGIIFTSIFGLGLRFFVVGNFVHITESLWGFFKYIFFAALAIAIPKIAMTTKLLRSSILSELNEDYVRTAYSRGNNRKQVLKFHVLRNSIIPAVSFLAITIAEIVAGSIIIEQVFAIPGIGRLLLASISNRDFTVVQAIVVMIATVVLLVNLLADVLYQYIDPRIKLN